MAILDDLRIESSQPLLSPEVLGQQLPLTDATKATVTTTRRQIEAILNREDDRLIVIVGPCSIHDQLAAIEFAQRLKQQIQHLSKSLLVIMRVYFEKPRTTIGWKGLINDPYLNDSFDVNHGLHLSRHLLLMINGMGVPTGSEFLDVITPQYIADLTSWSAIGARTTESQIHRQLASGLSTPVGFKNSCSGDVQVAINAVYTAKFPQHFLGVGKNGMAAIVSTRGNENCHIILRGGHNGPNYHSDAVDAAVKLLRAKQLPTNVMVDCSHGNSPRDQSQLEAAANLAQQIAQGNQNIIGLMLESHLVSGKQKLIPGKPLVYGQSITDHCLGWEETVQILELLSRTVTIRRRGIRSSRGLTAGSKLTSKLAESRGQAAG